MSKVQGSQLRVAPILSTQAGEELGLRLEYALACLGRGLPFGPFLIDQDEQVEDARELILRLLRSGMANASLQTRLADLIERIPTKELPAALSVRLPTRRKGFEKDRDTHDAYFYRHEESGDVAGAVVAAYDKHFGSGAYERDRLIDCEDRDAWPYANIACTVASKRLLDTILPRLKQSLQAGHRPAQLLALLGFSC